MVRDFSRTLSLLRREKKVSQRQASLDLGISQALLSHYENGVREPGLKFLVRAADYYGVSTDYLLGRAMSKDGTHYDVEDLPDASLARDNVLKGSASAALSKKLLINGISVLFDVLGRCESQLLIQEVIKYLYTAFYKAYRMVYAKNAQNPTSAFSIGEPEYSALADAQMKLCEYRIKGVRSDGVENLTNDALQERYPVLAKSLFSVLHNAAEKMEGIDQNGR